MLSIARIPVVTARALAAAIRALASVLRNETVRRAILAAIGAVIAEVARSRARIVDADPASELSEQQPRQHREDNNHGEP